MKPVGVVPAQPGARELLGPAAGGRRGVGGSGGFRISEGGKKTGGGKGVYVELRARSEMIYRRNIMIGRARA